MNISLETEVGKTYLVKLDHPRFGSLNGKMMITKYQGNGVFKFVYINNPKLYDLENIYLSANECEVISEYNK